MHQRSQHGRSRAAQAQRDASLHRKAAARSTISSRLRPSSPPGRVKLDQPDPAVAVALWERVLSQVLPGAGRQHHQQQDRLWGWQAAPPAAGQALGAGRQRSLIRDAMKTQGESGRKGVHASNRQPRPSSPAQRHRCRRVLRSHAAAHRRRAARRGRRPCRQSLRQGRWRVATRAAGSIQARRLQP